MSMLSVVPAETMNLADRVAAEVRAELARRQITQQEFAPAIGLSQASLSERMRGKTPFTIEDLERVAGALGVHPAELLGGSGGGNGPQSPPPVTGASTPVSDTPRDGNVVSFPVGSNQGSGAMRTAQADAA